MKFSGFAVTHTENKDSINRENYFLNGFCKDGVDEADAAEENISFEKRKMYAVADGAASEILGEEAAALTVNVLKDFYNLNIDFGKIHTDCFDAINTVVGGRIFENDGKNSYSSLAALYINKNRATVYSVGNVSVFRYDGKKLSKISKTVPQTTDVEELVENEDGIIEARTATKKCVPYLGITDNEYVLNPFISESFRVKSSDVFLICSDGIAENVDEKTLSAVLSDKGLKYDEKAMKLIDIAVKNGAKSDVTALVVQTAKQPNYMIYKTRGFAVAVALLICALVVALSYNFISSNVKSFINYFSQQHEEEDPTSEKWVPLNPGSESDDTAPQSEPVQTQPEAQPENTEPVQNTPPQENTNNTNAPAANNAQQPRTRSNAAPSAGGGQTAAPVQRPAETPAPAAQPSEPVQSSAPSAPQTSAPQQPQQNVTQKAAELPIDFNNQ